MIFVIIGGSFGAMSRYVLSKWLAKWFTIPVPTLFINLLGSFLLGVVLQIDPPHSLYLLFATGFLGAFTTFSTFSYEALTLLLAKKHIQGFCYLVGSMLLSFLGCWFGLMI